MDGLVCIESNKGILGYSSIIRVKRFLNYLSISEIGSIIAVSREQNYSIILDKPYY